MVEIKNQCSLPSSTGAGEQTRGGSMSRVSDKRLEAKKNHHHVWARYMRRWATNGRDVYFTKKNREIGFDSVKSIAVERDFYKVGYLKGDHIELIRLISSFADADLQQQHASYLSDFILIQKLEEKYNQSDVANEDIDKCLRALKSNGIENYHTAHENEVQNIMERLANRDLSILDDKRNMIDFMMFYGHQITRTKNFKERVVSSLSIFNDELGFDIQKIANESWWFLGYMLGMNIGRSLYFERHSDTHCLLINDTLKPFITSDQPIVNVYQEVPESLRVLEDHECDHFFPISPNVAYMVNKSDRFPKGVVEVSEGIVDEMNIKIAKSSLVNIISNSEESLVPYRKYIGDWHNKIKTHYLSKGE